MSTSTLDRQVEEMTGTVRKRTRLPRGQVNEALHNHDGLAGWRYDGLSLKDGRLHVWRCYAQGCQATMTTLSR